MQVHQIIKLVAFCLMVATFGLMIFDNGRINSFSLGTLAVVGGIVIAVLQVVSLATVDFEEFQMADNRITSTTGKPELNSEYSTEENHGPNGLRDQCCEETGSFPEYSN
ncbi:unnamed protein product [Nesidiocoris tenuis]|uniref:Uncharacterized protein n=1 Tax=Nesidiocoris tenuis TaxID=355587 RepID=A0A6H5GGW5_9HEMI|nr:unnamed protein product [Nesidiocoris tenuis]